MSRFITVPQADGKMAIINIERVNYVYEYKDKDTVVDFDGGGCVRVAMSFEDFAKLIYAADDTGDDTEPDEPEPHTGLAKCVNGGGKFTVGVYTVL